MSMTITTDRDETVAYEVKILKPNQKFWAMLHAYRKQAKLEHLDTYKTTNILGLDPGETTGTCVWDWVNGVFCLLQLKTSTVEDGFREISGVRKALVGPDSICVCEDYKVYAWKSDTHKWAGLHTPQLIGAIKVLCLQTQTPLYFQMAQEAKSWATDDQLKSWNLYDPGQRHARDATRHIIRHMFFNKEIQERPHWID